MNVQTKKYHFELLYQCRTHVSSFKFNVVLMIFFSKKFPLGNVKWVSWTQIRQVLDSFFNDSSSPNIFPTPLCPWPRSGLVIHGWQKSQKIPQGKVKESKEGREEKQEWFRPGLRTLQGGLVKLKWIDLIDWFWETFINNSWGLLWPYSRSWDVITIFIYIV